MPERLSSPDQLPSMSWSLLQHAIEHGGAFRLPVLATGSGSGVDARTLVLRAASLEHRMLECHTDTRAAKVEQVRQHPDMLWVFYDEDLKLQLRLRGRGQVLGDQAQIDTVWQALSAHTQRAYAQPLNPGTSVDTLDGAAPCPDVKDPQVGRQHFAVIQCQVTQIHWLALDRNGHECAKATFEQDQWSCTWVMP